MQIIKSIALRACNDYRKTIRNGPVENRRPLTLLLFPSNTDLPRSTFPRRWLWKWRLFRKPRLEQCAPNVESYNLHTLPPYPKNLSPTPSWGPNAIEWSVSRQAAGSIGFVPDTTIFLLFPSPLLHLSPLPRFVFSTLYLRPPSWRTSFSYALSFATPLLSYTPLLVHLNLQLFFSCPIFHPLYYCDLFISNSSISFFLNSR